MRELFEDQAVDDTKLWNRIKDIVIKSILAIEGFVFASCETNVKHRNNCFELFGFDVLIDDLLNPWLLEVNLSPSLNCDAPIDQKIKSELISDLFNLIGVVSMESREKSSFGSDKQNLNYLAYMQKFIPFL